MVRLASNMSGPLLGGDFPLSIAEPFTGAQAAAAGVSRRVLARLVRDGYLRRLLRGVYVAAQVPDSLELRVKALGLVVPPHAVVVDWTAVWIWTGELPPNDHLRVPPISVFVHAGKGRLRNEYVAGGERSFVPGDLTVVGNITVTVPLRTAWDIGRLSHRDLAFAGLDLMLRRGGFGHDEMLAGIERFKGHRGVRQLRALAPLADARAESPSESVLRLRWLDLPSLPSPTPQVPIFDDSGRAIFYLDLGVEELRFAAEYDGEEFHSSEADRRHDMERRAWVHRERDWIIAPVTRRNVYGPTRDIERILHEGTANARRRLGQFRRDT